MNGNLEATRRLVHLRDLVHQLVLRDLKGNYRSSFLGILWSLMNPLLQLLVFTFLFRVVMPLGAGSSAALFAGLIAWTWFQISMTQATTAITSHRELIRRPGFPQLILPVVTVATNLINFTLALPLLLTFHLLMGGKVHGALFYLPVIMGLQFLFTLSLAYFLAALNVLFRDTQHLAGVVLQMLFYVTPIFYSLEQVPERFRAVYQVNPLLHLVAAYRAILIQGVSPDWTNLSMVTLVTMVLLGAGYSLFCKTCDAFVEEL